MGDDDSLARTRKTVADRRLRDLVQRARRLQGTPPEATLKEGLAMIDSVHSLEIREA